jgi:hypothetical protein
MAQMINPAASKKIHMDRIRPKILIPPSDLREEKSTKYPTVTQNVNGTNENQTHIKDPPSGQSNHAPT